MQIENQSDDTALLALQGRKALDTLQNFTNINLSEIPYYHYKIGTVAGINEVIVSATGYTGSGGLNFIAKNETVGVGQTDGSR